MSFIKCLSKLLKERGRDIEPLITKIVSTSNSREEMINALVKVISSTGIPRRRALRIVKMCLGIVKEISDTVDKEEKKWRIMIPKETELWISVKNISMRDLRDRRMKVEVGDKEFSLKPGESVEFSIRAKPKELVIKVKPLGNDKASFKIVVGRKDVG